jgi:hypothetical protein
MNNPFENCILVMRAAIQQYITDNQQRESASANCFQVRSWLRQGYDTALARQKMLLADHLDYTLEHLAENYQKEMGRLGKIPADLAARLAYMELIKGFARLQDCIEAGTLAEAKMNQNGAGAGLLAATLKQCKKTYDSHWLQAKENIWSSPILHGVMFDHNEEQKAQVMARFNTDLGINRHQFTSILARPEKAIEVPLSASQRSPRPPAYASEEDLKGTGIGPNPFMEIKVGGNVVTIHQK